MCFDAQSSCKSDSEIYSGMKWAVNGQSVLLRCCSIKVPSKIYVGTDLVALGSYYVGGLVDKRDLFGQNGPEFDFISNIRTEQGGVRVWVYRVMCAAAVQQHGANSLDTAQIQESNDDQVESTAVQQDEVSKTTLIIKINKIK
ncbi:unnamed protein product [Anisakis simplex]|uniref:TFIIIC_sub6 domain-containing protein n=1 Tax=Anisakis simplex TaxID=6269 RepID=A0A0M3JDH1_ANISI|nr:unnamed protein product [Anisakis simplex]